jgi:hypothetical protein
MPGPACFTDREGRLCEREVAARRLPLPQECTVAAIGVVDIQFTGEFFG